MNASTIVKPPVKTDRLDAPPSGNAFALDGEDFVEHLRRMKNEEQAEQDRKAELARLGELARFD